jgi:hypothetical protein
VGIFTVIFGFSDTDLPRDLIFLACTWPAFSLAAFVVNLGLNLFRFQIPEVDLPPMGSMAGHIFLACVLYPYQLKVNFYLKKSSFSLLLAIFHGKKL